ncbi:helix-turn-helix transcriptional regulator [Crocosphaera sp. XPORK-15E]|uniref:helix-turn-helix domain-containing protein n=1 Tax=Crocosphaera sp. XPORK-15E TaxID=3110247 RepID=UPI002B1F55ED|nr:helix-turn-helix transcriptional regulator [Crocosphaera sp. XPORK-15E]MEA5534542.1 helix-turn-helix transcriptional regulator [Crocosphaera sp. XPORK-15E]
MTLIFSPRYRRFRELLIQARLEKNITQVELAKKLGKPQSYISKYERGERRLDLIEFLDIADALMIDPYEFIRQLKDGNS